MPARPDLKGFIGQRVEIPVHYDLWMRGARYGIVKSAHSGKSGQSDYLKVKMDNPRIKKLVKIWALDVPYMKTLGVSRNPRKKRRTRTKLTKRDVDLLLLASGQLHEDEVSGAAPSNEDWDKLHRRGLIRQDKYSHFPNGLTKKGFNAINRKIVVGNPRKKRRSRKVRRETLHARLIGRRNVRALGARKNPGRFVICATIARHGKDWYFRRSTESFVDNIKDATKYQSASHAWSVAKSIKDQLPRAIKSIKVDEI